jgi:hypothetical protein
LMAASLHNTKRVKGVTVLGHSLFNRILLFYDQMNSNFKNQYIYETM